MARSTITLGFETEDEVYAEDLARIIKSIAVYMVDNVTVELRHDGILAFVPRG